MSKKGTIEVELKINTEIDLTTYKIISIKMNKYGILVYELELIK